MRSQKLTKTLTASLIALVTVSVATSATFAETTSKDTGPLEKTNAELAEQMAGPTADIKTDVMHNRLRDVQLR